MPTGMYLLCCVVNNFQNIRLELMEEQLEQLGASKSKVSSELNIFGLDDM